MTHVLAFNSGSSSLKFGLHWVDAASTRCIASGAVEGIGVDPGLFVATAQGSEKDTRETIAIVTQEAAVARIVEFLRVARLPLPDVIGHRIVHGGALLTQHCHIDAGVMEKLDRAVDFAPLHTPISLAVIKSAQDRFPKLPNVACFDTTFHAEMPDIARVLPLPKALQLEGIRRYGFHGLSCESIIHRLESRALDACAVTLPRRIVIAHLGNGASVTAIREGKSVDTSMGLTPSGGIIMGTRTGDIDPGVLLYLMRVKALDASSLGEIVDRQSGLLGISGLTSDMRRLHAGAVDNPNAQFAIEMFCYSARKQIAAMIAAMDGIDLLVFSGGVGENDPIVRRLICEGLTWIGIKLDGLNNANGVEEIHGSRSRCQIKVIASQESERIAHHSWRLICKAARS